MSLCSQRSELSQADIDQTPQNFVFQTFQGVSGDSAARLMPPTPKGNQGNYASQPDESFSQLSQEPFGLSQVTKQAMRCVSFMSHGQVSVADSAYIEP